MKKHHICCKMPRCMLPGVNTCQECRFSGFESYEACEKCGIMLADGETKYCKACKQKAEEEQKAMNNIPDMSVTEKLSWILSTAQNSQKKAIYWYSPHITADYNPDTKKLTCKVASYPTPCSSLLTVHRKWSIDNAPEKPNEVDEIYRQLYRIYEFGRSD